MVKAKILQLLRQNEGYVSGQDICQMLGVSRTAVWKAIKQLKDAGYEIDAIQNKGYHLSYAPDRLTDNELYSIKKTGFTGSQIFYYEEVDSTNNAAKRLADEGAPHGSIVIADIQNAGKGRRGRTWNSPPMEGIWFTILLKPEIHPGHASMLTLVMAIAVTKGILHYTGLAPMIKWPNDIVLDSKKVCGILTEMSIQMDDVNHIIVGAGINVHNIFFPKEIEETATSLYIEMQKQNIDKKVIRAELLSVILEEFENYYEIFCKTEDLSAIYEEYNRYLVNKGREVKIIEPKNEYKAKALGINQIGELIIDKDGEQKKISSGEVSVRGIYGYI